MRITSLLLASLLLLVGCESPDRVLTNAERLLGSRTGRTVLDIATGKDPKQILKERVDAYQRDPEAVLRDLRTIQRDFNTLMTALTGRVRQTWGEKEVKVPEQKKYVKYTQNYMSRTIVDFDSGSIVVETLDDKAPKESLKNAIVTTLLTPDDPRSVDLFFRQAGHADQRSASIFVGTGPGSTRTADPHPGTSGSVCGINAQYR